MRVLQVIEALTRGGAERLVVELAGEFASRGHDSRVLCLSEGGPWAARLEAAGLYAGCLGKRPGADLACLGRLRRFIAEASPDVVHAHLFTANLWARLAGLARRRWALVATLHNIDTWRTVVHRAADRALSRAADRYVAVGRAVADYYLSDCIPPDRLRVIPNAVRWNGTRISRPLEADLPVLRACGRLVPQKGFDVLVRAAAKLAESTAAFRIEIIGDGPERAALEKLARRGGLSGRVLFLGARDDARELIAAADVFVMPSLREGLPLVLLEALHAGRPIVASALGSLEGVVADGREALLAAPGSPGALARAIERVLADREAAREMGRAGARRARAEFSMERAASSYIEVYREALKERKR